MASQGKVRPPSDVAAAFRQAVELARSGRLAEAEALYRGILQKAPDHFDALHLLSLATHRQGRREEALGLIERALALKADSALALSNYGLMLTNERRLDEALARFDRAIAIKPDFAEALNYRGRVLRALRRSEDALASIDRALALKPDHAEAHFNRGNVLQDLGRHGDALASYDRAIAIKPDHAEALNNRGYLLRELGRYEEAVAAFERLLAVAPDHEYALGALHSSRMHSCDWISFEEPNARVVENVRAGKRAAIPFLFLAMSDSPGDHLACARTFVKSRYPAAPSPVWNGERYSHDKIRIAYLSADFHDHPMAYLMAGLFEQHDRSRFETTAISFGPNARSELRSRLERAFDRFIDVRAQSDREVADLLRGLEIDIAVDRKGFTSGRRTGIFALRPAPIQVNYLAYPGTMGAEYIDYIIADRVVIPDEQHAHYSEKVVTLPDCYQVNDSTRRIAERTPSRAEAGLPETGFVFCCFNNCYKITPAMFDVWMRLLRQVEGSVLWLMASNAEAVRNLRREAAARQVAPQRLVFAARVPHDEHLARHRLADLFLDTLPINAHTGCSDALWAGLPVLTLTGNAFAGRVASSLLRNIGIAELALHNPEEYEAQALELASNPARLAAIRARLAAHRGSYPLFDTARFRRHIEAAYTAMWQRQQRGEPPASFAIPPSSPAV